MHRLFYVALGLIPKLFTFTYQSFHFYSIYDNFYSIFSILLSPTMVNSAVFPVHMENKYHLSLRASLYIRLGCLQCCMNCINIMHFPEIMSMFYKLLERKIYFCCFLLFIPIVPAYRGEFLCVDENIKEKHEK